MPYKSDLFVDLDGVLHDGSWPTFGNLRPGVCEALQALRDRGHKVYIYSCRFNAPDGGPFDDPTKGAAALEFLRKHAVPHDGIWRHSKPCGVIIDDRAITFDPKTGDWRKLAEVLGAA